MFRLLLNRYVFEMIFGKNELAINLKLKRAF